MVPWYIGETVGERMRERLEVIRSWVATNKSRKVNCRQWWRWRGGEREWVKRWRAFITTTTTTWPWHRPWESHCGTQWQAHQQNCSLISIGVHCHSTEWVNFYLWHTQANRRSSGPRSGGGTLHNSLSLRIDQLVIGFSMCLKHFNWPLHKHILTERVNI